MKNISNRYIILDTETTGMSFSGTVYKNHRIIEIGAIEMINRTTTNKIFHVYINPERNVDIEAFKIHGISDNFLLKQKKFIHIINDFLNFINGTNLVVHNASFDVSFLDNELKLLNHKIKSIRDICNVIDTLSIARKLFPGKKNNLDALCSRYNIPLINRKLHSAIIDANLLKKVYLKMTSKQKQMNLFIQNSSYTYHDNDILNLSKKNKKMLKIQKASLKDVMMHNQYLKYMFKKNKKCLWKI
ncbi:DNA polymerase III subunit epsilon [Buchnera aphidicola (Thelaxes suberi)]|uniref:DNA polymerase III subunit epsilon n=1 Tax=Buchnera aphidicola TaxID=9 RepID=UPI003464AC9F